MTVARNIGLGAAAIFAAAALIAPTIYDSEGDVRVGYRDMVGVPTACSGHTRTAVVGRQYSADQCLAFLVMDIAEHAAGIQPYIKVPVPTPSMAAFISFTFNFGVDDFRTSTMLRKLNAGDLRGACAELSRWNKVKRSGRYEVAPGLVVRRAKERAYCERGLHA